jgi:hypothetical protein
VGVSHRFKAIVSHGIGSGGIGGVARRFWRWTLPTERRSSFGEGQDLAD